VGLYERVGERIRDMTRKRPVSRYEKEQIKLRFFMKEGLLFKVDKKGFKQTGMYKDKRGRHTVNFLGRIWYVHRIAYYLYTEVWPGDFSVDHIDGDPSNNLEGNLRLLTQHQNMLSFNKPTVGAGSIYRGVCYDKEKRLWLSQIVFQRDRKLKKRFKTELEAALAYNYKAKELGFNKEAFNLVFKDVPQELLDVET